MPWVPTCSYQGKRGVSSAVFSASPSSREAITIVSHKNVATLRGKHGGVTSRSGDITLIIVAKRTYTCLMVPIVRRIPIISPICSITCAHKLLAKQFPVPHDKNACLKHLFYMCVFLFFEPGISPFSTGLTIG